MHTSDLRQYAPATQRNREPILAVLQKVLPPSGTILEIASGSGEHAVFFAPHFPQCQWLPSDHTPTALGSIAAWREAYPAPNLLAPIALDVHDRLWPLEPASPSHQSFSEMYSFEQITAIVNINMIHISPWSACLALMSGADRILPKEGILYLYGPFQENGQHTAPSNAAFDAKLRSENPEWGVRALEDVVAVAEGHGLSLREKIPMPANNLSVIFQKNT